MTKLRLISNAGNVYLFRENTISPVRKVTFAELQELAERDDYDRILDAAGPNSPIPKAVLKNWSEGKEFDAFTFYDAACNEHEADFSGK